MSFSITLFGPKNFWWKWNKDVSRTWFYHPSKSSPGRAGFCIPGLHVDCAWGRKKVINKIYES